MSLDLLIGAAPFVVSFFYLVYANVKVEREEDAFGRVLDDPSFTTDDRRQRTDDDRSKPPFLDRYQLVY